MIKKVFFLVLFSILSAVVFGQSKEELQRKQQDLLKEIRDLNASLKDIRKNKNRSLANYNLVRRKIAAREELIQNTSNYDYLNFMFSSATFNDAIKRITYLKSYLQYREQQVANIEKTQDLISNKIATLNNSKNEKSLALKDQNNQLKDLEIDKK